MPCWTGCRAKIWRRGRQNSRCAIGPREPRKGLKTRPMPWPMCWSGRRRPRPWPPVLARAMAVMGEFAPASLLDVGAGPGSASWAAADLWPGIAVTMLDRNAALRALAAKLMPEATILAGDLAAPKLACDLVMANYVLAEFPLNAVAR